MLDNPKNGSNFLQLPQELRDYIYSFLVSENQVVLRYENEVPRLWELRVSQLPNTTSLLYVNRQISLDYTKFALQIFSKSKIVISTNALTSALPIQFTQGQPRALLELIPNLVIQTSADWKWWIKFTYAPWPLTLESNLLAVLPNRSSVELICRLVGRSIFIPDSLRETPRAEGNLRTFFEHQVPVVFKVQAPSPTVYSSTSSQPSIIKTKVTKSLILNLEPLQEIFGNGATGQTGFRDHLNRCGATFPETDDWVKLCNRPLDPILRWRIAPPPHLGDIADFPIRYDYIRNVITCHISEEIDVSLE